MSIDTYPPQSTQATVVRTDSVMIQGGTGGGGNASPGAWTPAGTTTMRAFWTVPEAYAGGDVTFTWKRRMATSVGVSVMTYALDRLRVGAAVTSIIASTSAGFTAADTTSQSFPAVAPAGTFLAGDSLRFTMIRDGDNASDTYTLDVFSDGLSITYNAYVMGYAAYPASVNNASYEEGTFTVTATGFTATITGTAYYVRVGKQITLMLPELNGTSNSATFTVTGLPAGLAPARATRLIVLAHSSGTYIYSMLYIPSSSTVINVFRDASQTAWITSGVKVLYDCTLVYHVS